MQVTGSATKRVLGGWESGRQGWRLSQVAQGDQTPSLPPKTGHPSLGQLGPGPGDGPCRPRGMMGSRSTNKPGFLSDLSILSYPLWKEALGRRRGELVTMSPSRIHDREALVDDMPVLMPC